MSAGEFLGTIAGSGVFFGAVFAFVQFLISRHDQKKDAKNGLRKDVKDLKNSAAKSEKDSCRTQLLLLIADYPTQKEEILTIAQHYFKDLKANWYMTALFQHWCNDYGVDIPAWAKSGEEKI